MADRGGYDIRLEAAAAKEWNSVQGWRLFDETMQIRGGRGYETETSLRGRGEQPIGVERMMRDARINMIFEGSSEVMHLFMAREAVDKHLSVAGAIIDKKVGIGGKIAALPGIAWFYARWYTTRWLGWGWWPRYSAFGKMARHLRFVDRNARKLARQTFHGMLVHQADLERKQGFLFRIVDIGLELLAISSSVSRAHAMAKAGGHEGKRAIRLADLFARRARRRVKVLFHDLWRNDDKAMYALGQEVLKGEDAWMEREELVPEEVAASEPETPEKPAPPPAAPQPSAAP
jgi:hypothetical protein